jgi:hypothetical protein
VRGEKKEAFRGSSPAKHFEVIRPSGLKLASS